MQLLTFNCTEEEEAELVRMKLREAHSIFQQDAMADGDPIMCQLHDAFGTYDTSHHNCLGCNFADSVLMIDAFLKTHEHQTSIQSAFSTFIILAYLLVERMDTLFDIIVLNQAYRDEHFKVLTEIRKWANFLKHPKAFLLTHHPTFSFDTSSKYRELRRNASVRIDRAFVNTYYSDDKQNTELLKKLENKEDVLVVLPDIVRLARDLCKAMKQCVSVVRDNPVYRRVLEDKTTFRDYWIDE